MLDLVEELAAGIPDEQRYADPDLQPPADPNEIDDAAFARVLAAVQPLRELDDAALRRWFGRFITRYRAAGDIAAPPKPASAAKVADTLAAGGRLLRHPHARVAWNREGRRARLHASGLAFDMGVASAKALAAAESLDAAAVAALDDDGRAALQALVTQGHYHLDKPRRR